MAARARTEGSGDTRRSLLSRLGERFGKTAQQLEVDALLQESERSGGTRVSQLANRQVATVSGTVRAVTLRPRVNVPALVVDLYDGSQTMNLIWLGRRSIAGIEPGTYLRATGRVTFARGVPTIFNPAYEIVPTRAS